jgi:RNA polymerase sigma-70 factor (ECF subfamily)
MEERAWIVAWGKGDKAAGARLIERFYDGVERFFASKAGPGAADLVQTTFTRCAAAAAGYRGESSARTFIFGIARNVLFEFIRSAARDRRVDPDMRASAVIDLVPGVVTQLSERSSRQRMLEALQRIPLELQMALELYYWEDLSVEELAQVLEIPKGTVKSRLFRAREALRAQMGPGDDQLGELKVQPRVR